jgi:hypothetical protein
MTAELRQGEIITDLGKYIVNPVTQEVAIERYDFSVIATQDCDLLQDFNRRAAGEQGSLSGVLMFPMITAFAARDGFKGKEMKTRIFQNKDERYHLLQRVAADQDLLKTGLPPLLVDFKRFFTMSPDELFHQFRQKTAARRCRLEMPYREHLQVRAAFYFQRIMLPEPHVFDFESEKSLSKA